MTSTNPIPTRALGGDASSINVGQMGIGLMGMTWVPSESAFTPDDRAFETIRAAVDSGSNLLDAGAFYGPQSDPTANIKLLRRFFDAHPDYLGKVTLFVKGGMDLDTYAEKGLPGLRPNHDIDYLRRELGQIRDILGSDKGGHDIDVFMPSRKSPDVEIEDLMKTVRTLQSEGLFKHIALSEVSAETIQRAAKVAPIAAVEVEYSPIERIIEENGVLEACEKLQIPILAYSPLGKGWLGGAIKSRDDLKNDIRTHLDKFSEANVAANAALAEKYVAEAKKRGVQTSQLALAWLIQQSPTGIIIPIPGTTKPERARENNASATVKISQDNLKEIRTFIEQNSFHGGRYNEHMRQHGNLFT